MKSSTVVVIILMLVLSFEPNGSLSRHEQKHTPFVRCNLHCIYAPRKLSLGLFSTLPSFLFTMRIQRVSAPGCCGSKRGNPSAALRAIKGRGNLPFCHFEIPAGKSTKLLMTNERPDISMRSLHERIYCNRRIGFSRIWPKAC
jgi:hypothetical protein